MFMPYVLLYMLFRCTPRAAQVMYRLAVRHRTEHETENRDDLPMRHTFVMLSALVSATVPK